MDVSRPSITTTPLRFPRWKPFTFGDARVHQRADMEVHHLLDSCLPLPLLTLPLQYLSCPDGYVGLTLALAPPVHCCTRTTHGDSFGGSPFLLGS